MNEKTKILIIVEDGRDELDAAAKEVKGFLAADAVVKTRCATEVAVAEILAADSYAFGVDDASAHAWVEVKRLLQGINLAGRKAVVFAGKPGAAASFETSLKPSGLSALPPVAVPTRDKGAWAAPLATGL